MNKILEAANRGSQEGLEGRSQEGAKAGLGDDQEGRSQKDEALEPENVGVGKAAPVEDSIAEVVQVEEGAESYLIQKSHPRSRDRWAKGLSNPEAIFVKSFCEGLTGADAARTAGIGVKDLSAAGVRLLKKRRIQDAVTAFRAFSLKALHLEPEDITRGFAAIAFADISDYFDENGAVLAPKDMPNSAAVQEITMTVKPDGTKTYKIKLGSKIDATKELAKFVGYYAGHEKAKRPLNINLSGLSIEELRKLAQMDGEETIDITP